ncbi:MAG: hypothetical protein A2161_17175 [Candidatus Schekmanbacteria bacterium RBG_13_48_7]|uniref:TonB-dependent receptor-like beta-barrel domain-containing protein n=1 Tax=Candidatus Schekmanbacteria bacterium RBG_13_48_7 TaxID=1817878 RepID=A0A1F7S0X0_9BACT|nr:MAG: hypothetical protein A2161_17175 [Candidatus Schekmanbacteria bacterium RBG_13_48_7]
MGDEFDNGGYFFSFTYTNSNGFSEHGSGKGSTFYQWGYPDDVDELNPYVTTPVLTGEDGLRLLDFSPSFELYGKITVGEFTLKSRASYMAQDYLWETIYGVKSLDVVMKHFLTEIEHNKILSENSTLTTKVNVHCMLYERGVPKTFKDPDVTADLETMTEIGVGAETIYNTTIADTHHIIAGLKVSDIRIGPSLRHEYFIGDGSTTKNDDYPWGYKYFIVVDPDYDNTYGMYLEDNFKATKDLSIVGGLSYEYNDLREKGGQTMPRAAVIYQLTDSLTVKYSYNTGYQRPPAQKKFSKHFGYVKKSEKIFEHDFQLSYNNDRFRASATGFRYKISDYFTWYDEGYDPVTNEKLAVGHFNKGEARSHGVELDARYNLTKSFSFYGNYTYADTKINDDYVIGEPHHFYNLGFDWNISKDFSLNLNVNGWYDMYHGKDTNNRDLFWDGTTEQIVDLCLLKQNIKDRFDLTVYADNLLDNKVHVGMTGWPGYTYLQGFSAGMKVTVEF